MSVEINATNFPDAVWRQYVSTYYDTDKDGILSDEEIEAVTRIASFGTALMPTAEFVNIEVFPNIEYVVISTKPSANASLKRVKVSNCPVLTRVEINGADLSHYLASSDSVYHASLEQLEISNCPELMNIECACNSLNSLSLSNIPKLETLDLRCNLLRSLDLRSVPSLVKLYCWNNGVLEYVNLTGLEHLLNITLCRNNLLSLNLPNSPKLRLLDCHSNTLSHIDISTAPYLVKCFRDIMGRESGYCYNANEPNKAISYGHYFPYDEVGGPGEITVDQNVRITYSDIVTAPVITTQPSSVTIVEGHTASFSISADGGDLKYQWQIQSGNEWADLQGATTAQYSVYATIDNSGNTYRCKVSNAVGLAYSDTAVLTVEADTTIRLTPPIITSHPSSVSAEDGQPAVFSVTADGEDLHYQWQTYQNETWYNIANAESSVYTITTALSLNRKQYRCQVSNAAGVVNSNFAYLYVTSSANLITTPSITNQPLSISTVEAQTATFRIVAKGGSLSYQWQIKRGNSWYDITGATNPIYSTRASTSLNNTQYRCRVSNSAGTVYSSSATLTVRELGPQPIYGYHSIIISGKNTYGEWEMYPTSRPHVAPPEVKTSYVDVPGADGGLDYTELLNEKPNYGYRKGSWEFLLIPQEKWPDVYRSLCNYLHGREHTIILEDDPNVVYTGRLSVNQWQSAAHNSLITIDYILDPVAVNTQDESYNPDEEYLDGAEKILRRPENLDCVLSLIDNQITIVPIDSLYEDGDNIAY